MTDTHGIFLPKKFFITVGSAVSHVSPLNAFDAALVKAGIAQCNLVPVSSIIPPDAEKVKPVHGIELGPFGTFTLRVVQPWIINGKLVGYIELGEEIEHFTPRLSRVLDIELVFVINKKYLNRDKWGEGLKVLGMSGKWDASPDFVVINNSKGIEPLNIQHILSSTLQQPSDQLYEIIQGNRNYRSGIVPLMDAGNKQVGNIIVLKEVTDEIDAVRTLSYHFGIFSAIISGLMIIIFWFLLGKMERNLQKTRKDLENKIKDHKQAQEEKDVFNKLIRRLTNPLTLKECAKVFAEETYNLFQYDAFSFDVVDEDNKMLAGIYNEDTKLGEKIPQEEPVFSHPLDTVKNIDVLEGKPKLINREKHPEQSDLYAYGSEIRLSMSLMFVPLRYENKTIGIISVQSYAADKYDNDDLSLFQTLSDHVGGAIIRIQSEERQKASEKRFKDIANSMADWIWEVDAEGRFTYCSDKVQDILGYTADEILGKTHFDMMVPEEVNKITEIFGEIIANKEVIKNLENWNVRKDGRRVCLLTNGVPILDENGDLLGYRGIDNDITERKQAEEEIKKARDEADEKALQAELANSAKSDFLANMSHEIRTPMNGVIGMTGLLLDTSLTSEQREYTETIRTSGDSLLTVINDILDFSKIESGKLDLELQTFSLNACMEEAFDIIVSKAEEKNIELVQIVDKNAPASIIGDVTRLRQILVNLLNNAIKFTEKGEIVLTVKSKKINSKTHEFHFTVKDTGIGIPKDRMDRLFKSFSQVDSSTTRKYGGTGLGLTISKKLSEMMGGSMWVESEEGKGSTFHFTIIAESVNTSGKEYMEDPSPFLKDKKVLIVDDNATNRKLVVLQVESWGMKPVAVESGIEALDLLKSGKKFNLAIIDMQMPEMDGIDLAKEIRKIPNGKDLPFIMLTSLGKRKEDSEAIEKYFSAYLLKPIKQSQLYSAIISVVERRKTNDRFKKREVLIDSEMAEKTPLRILLAEDNIINQKVATRILQKMGYRADVVGNGAEAVKAVQDVSYDVVLMDVQMPVMDGFEATRQICKNDTRPQIIAMTANAMKGDREKCLEAGMDNYIAKPIKVEELIMALKNAANVSEELADA